MKVGSIKDVKVLLQVVLGETEKTVEQLATVGEGTIIELKSMASEPVDLLASGKKIAKGEVVVIDERFGIRVTQVLDREET